MDVKEIREALERGLDKEHQKKASDAMECMTTHRWFWRWAQDLESNCKDALSALSAFSAIDPEAIRREALQSVRKEIEEWRDDITCCDYDEGYLDGTENALKIIDAAILSAEPAQDDGKPEVGNV